MISPIRDMSPGRRGDITFWSCRSTLSLSYRFGISLISNRYAFKVPERSRDRRDQNDFETVRHPGKIILSHQYICIVARPNNPRLWYYL